MLGSAGFCTFLMKSCFFSFLKNKLDVRPAGDEITVGDEGERVGYCSDVTESTRGCLVAPGVQGVCDKVQIVFRTWECVASAKLQKGVVLHKVLVCQYVGACLYEDIIPVPIQWFANHDK